MLNSFFRDRTTRSRWIYRPAGVLSSTLCKSSADNDFLTSLLAFLVDIAGRSCWTIMPGWLHFLDPCHFSYVVLVSVCRYTYLSISVRSCWQHMSESVRTTVNVSTKLCLNCRAAICFFLVTIWPAGNFKKILLKDFRKIFAKFFKSTTRLSVFGHPMESFNCEVVESLSDLINYSLDYSIEQLNASSIDRRPTLPTHSFGLIVPPGLATGAMASTPNPSEVTMEGIKALLAENNITILTDMKKAYTTELNRALGPIRNWSQLNQKSVPTPRRLNYWKPDVQNLRKKMASCAGRNPGS